MNKLGKRVLSLLLTATMTVAMGLNVMAAPSPEKNGIVTEVVSAVDKNNTSVKVVVDKLSPANQAVVDKLNDAGALKAILKDKFVDGMKVLDACEVYVEGDGEIAYPVKVTFKVSGVLATTNVAVLQYLNGAWQQLEAKAGKGTITVTFNSLDELAPVSFVIDENTLASSNTSPKTGESNAMAAVAMIAVIAAAGAYGFRKKVTV